MGPGPIPAPPGADQAADLGSRSRGTTISALCSAAGGGERGAIRVSGPLAGKLLAQVVKVDSQPLVPTVRGVFQGAFHDGLGSCPVLVLWMPQPGSYTREDVVEFHLPGNPHLLQAAQERLLQLGAMSAQPGEFTRRAFENGALDLTRAEGVLALIESANESERRAATALLLGGLGERIQGLRSCVEDLRSLLEASLDFDESDTGHVPTEELEALFQASLKRLQQATEWESAREPVSDLPRVVLAGEPNAGKSSLYNALARGVLAGDEGDPRRDLDGQGALELDALVDSLAGSTRDVRRGDIPLGRGQVTLIDTAGVGALGERAKVSPVDLAAQERARGEIEGADLVLWVLDGGVSPPAILEPRGFLVWNKIDQPGVPAAPPTELIQGSLGWCAVSAREDTGMGELREALQGQLGLGPTVPSASPGEEPLSRQLRARHLSALRLAQKALSQAHGLQGEGAPLDLVAEALRQVTHELDAIEGATTPEDLLDRIFSRFCLGK